jgi:hypothetical protein
MVENFFHLAVFFFFHKKKGPIRKLRFAFSVLSCVLYILFAYIKKVMKPRKTVYLLQILLHFFSLNYVVTELLCFVCYTILLV